jgi:hypothetical protein
VVTDAPDPPPAGAGLGVDAVVECAAPVDEDPLDPPHEASATAASTAPAARAPAIG